MILIYHNALSFPLYSPDQEQYNCIKLKEVNFVTNICLYVTRLQIFLSTETFLWLWNRKQDCMVVGGDYN